eukprot:CAMPEP_0185257072 /NCGR_PEP_ID=MMETSP1359-20130426/6134_1 /TAXON_ID=552665 /ORGANISM="Bigelowiella longifila, Strain CCMP242" /LENGTH=202 /DNA_ID=CAMNT_0027841971 /DNA_START=840 /DNA_END=1444 /DNA_ORIENTATION=-
MHVLRMIIIAQGIDVLSKRRDPDKKYISVVGSWDRYFTRYIWSSRHATGDYRDQLATMVTQLCYKFVKINERPLQENERPMQNLLIYRHGVSESLIRDREGGGVAGEVRAIRLGLMKVFGKRGWPRPKITMVVVQKRTSTKFFRMQRDGSIHSPYPGTYVSSERAVSDPANRSFFIIPCKKHQNQGTAIPTKFTIIEQEAST